MGVSGTHLQPVELAIIAPGVLLFIACCLRPVHRWARKSIRPYCLRKVNFAYVERSSVVCQSSDSCRDVLRWSVISVVRYASSGTHIIIRLLRRWSWRCQLRLRPGLDGPRQPRQPSLTQRPACQSATPLIACFSRRPQRRCMKMWTSSHPSKRGSAAGSWTSCARLA